MDNFVLTRVLNHPELIFNQRPQLDKENERVFFAVDAQRPWNLSLRNECLVCQRYMYTQIFYERGVLAQNHDLIEIHDKKLLDKLRY